MAAMQDPWAPFTKKYKVHEETYAALQQAVALGAKPYSQIGVEGAREQTSRLSKQLAGRVVFQGDEKEVIVPSPYTEEGIPVSVYKPGSSPAVPAILIYFHGGGLVIGSRQSHETALKVIAGDSGAIVVNVEYRLLPNPESPYAPFDDANVVTEWVLAHKEAVGGRPDSKVGVGGDSAGGHIAAGVTNDIQGLDFQVLIYPMTDTTCKSETFQEFANAPGLTEDSRNWFFENSLKGVPDFTTNPRINAMIRTNTELSPPALILLAELDQLRGCGLDYAEKLRQAGVRVECVVIQGVPHAFFTLCNVYKTKCPEAYGHVVKFLKSFQ